MSTPATTYTTVQALDQLLNEGYDGDALITALADVINRSDLQQTEDGRDLLTEYEIDLVRDRINPRISAPFIERK